MHKGQAGLEVGTNLVRPCSNKGDLGSYDKIFGWPFGPIDPRLQLHTMKKVFFKGSAPDLIL